MARHGTMPKFIGNTELAATALVELPFSTLIQLELTVRKILQPLNGSQLFRNTENKLYPHNSLLNSTINYRIIYDN